MDDTIPKDTTFELTYSFEPHMDEGELSFTIREEETDHPGIVCVSEYHLDRRNTDKLRQALAHGGGDEALFEAIQEFIEDANVLMFGSEFDQFCKNHGITYESSDDE